MKKNKITGKYIVRNEGPIIFEKYKLDINKQKQVLEQFIKILKEHLNNIDPIILDIKAQIDKCNKDLQNKKTISLDNFYYGTYNLNITRLFDVSDVQQNYLKMINRLNTPPLNTQINNIPSDTYILIDDDSVSGNTLKSVLYLLPDDLIIEDIYLLSNLVEGKIFDVIDFRDFIIGSKNSGLTVRMPNSDIAKLPYILPYVSPKIKASIPIEKEFKFSLMIWEMNYDLFKDTNIQLKDSDIGFQIAMNYLGFNNDTNLSDICKWHIKRLKKEKI